MKDSAHLLSPAEAARIIIDAVRPLPSETVALAEAQDRVLVQDVTSPIDIPPWDNSAMDGYATLAIDVETGSELAVGEIIPAGARGTTTVERGTCARIFTGAPLPPGADTVVRQEDIETLPDRHIKIVNTRDRGRNVRPRGEDFKVGDLIAPHGHELRAGTLGLLASVAHAQVNVHQRPTVAILASGDEIVDVDRAEAILSGEKIASSNTYTMAALARAAGASVRLLGIARDDPDDIRTRLDQAEGAALLITSAGMSVGDHDHLRRILEESDTDTRFWRLRSRPGAPVGFGAYDGIPWIGLPGNPVSTFVTFELFVRPAIRKLRGLIAPFRKPRTVVLGESAHTPGRLQHFLRVRLEETNGMLGAYLTGPQGSGVLSSIAAADALLIVPEDRDDTPAGERLQALVLSDERYGEEIPY